MKKRTKHFKTKGILPTNILRINQNAGKGTVLWYTKTQQRKLYFVDSLGIPNGMAQVPPMLWLASKTVLQYLLWQMTEDPLRKRHCIMHFLQYLRKGQCMYGYGKYRY